MLKNIQIYGILHSTSLTIVDKRYKRKIYHLKQSSEGKMYSSLHKKEEYIFVQKY